MGGGQGAQTRKEGRVRWEPAHLSHPELTIASLEARLCLVRADLWREGSHSPRPPGPGVTPLTAKIGEAGLLPGAELAPRCPAGPFHGHLQELQHCGQHPTQPSAQTSEGTGLCVCTRVDAVERERWRSACGDAALQPRVQMNGGGAQKQVPGGWQC